MFNIGDQVQLNSSGPIMTVDELLNDRVKCKWFDSKQTLCEGIFNISSLQSPDDSSQTIRDTSDSHYRF